MKFQEVFDLRLSSNLMRPRDVKEVGFSGADDEEGEWPGSG